MKPSDFASIPRRLAARLKINAALSTAAATAPLRLLDDTDPASWEFTGFSQNGEDGVVDVLTRRLLAPTRHFLEIGASDGIENNTAWLAFARRFSGLMVEGDRRTAKRAAVAVASLPGVDAMNLFVALDNLASIRSRNAVDDLDVLSVDVDGNDWHVVNRLLETGLAPAVLVVEYNAVFGPDASVTIPYHADFSIRDDAYPSHLYFGASVGAWRSLCKRHGLRFLTVEQNGVNAFLVDPRRFEASFLDRVRGTRYRDNFYQRHAFDGAGWEERFERIEDRELQAV